MSMLILCKTLVMHVNTVSTGDERCFSRWDHVSSFISADNRQHDEQSESCDPLEPPQSACNSTSHGPHRCSIVVDGTDVSSRNRHDHQGYQGHQYSVFYQQFGAGKHFTIARQQGQSHDDTASNTRPALESFGPRLVYV
jgi:hypothetical protein